MKKALFQGSFDPFTLGHLDIVKRAAKLFDSVTVLIAANPDKRYMFTADERLKMIRLALEDAGVANADADMFEGLTSYYAREHGVTYMVRGLRNPSDYEYEKNIASFNKMLAPETETVYISCSHEYENISSSAVRELLKYSADISTLVPRPINKFIAERLTSDEQ